MNFERNLLIVILVLFGLSLMAFPDEFNAEFVVGLMSGLAVSQFFFMRRSQTERIQMSTLNALRSFARLQILSMAGSRMHSLSVDPAVKNRDVADTPTIVKAEAIRTNPKFVLLTIQDNGINFRSGGGGLEAIGFREDGTSIILPKEPVGFGLFLLLMDTPCTKITCTLKDQAGNSRTQKVTLL